MTDPPANPIVGIDLGTTYSLVAHVGDDGTPRVLPHPETGEPRCPSVVQVHDDGADVVGWAARRTRALHPTRTVTSVKRCMGLGPDEVRRVAPDLPYPVDEAPGGAARFRLGARGLTAPELSARVLRELARWASAALRAPVRRAVVTVPAYFNDAQRQATRDAGRLAGLEVLRILNEPTAASLAYGLDRLGEGTVAVYDLGGGTFDVSVLRVRRGVFQVLATAGDTQLGGDDVDAAIADWLLAAAADRLGPAAAEPAWRAAALAAAEAAKCALSTADAVPVTLEPPGAALAVTVELTRARCEALAAPVVDRTAAAGRRALADAGLTPADLDAVLLVGGQTRMPLVRARVAEWFAATPRCEIDPDHVVALGAAVQAAIIEGRRPGELLLDVIPLALGLEGLGGVMNKVLERNTPIPASATQLYTTGVDRQTHVEIHVLQGERELAADNRSLAHLRLGPLEPLPAGLPRVEVTFTVDENGCLRVRARDQRTLREQALEVWPTHGLTREAIDRLVHEAYDHAEADVQAGILASARVEADQLARRVAAALAEPDFSAGDERAAIEAALARLRTVAAGDDRMAILDVMHALETAGAAAMQRRADRAVAAALTDRHVTELLRARGWV